MLEHNGTVLPNMRWRFQVLILSASVLTVAGSVGASASNQSDPVSVHVQQKPTLAGSVHISFYSTDRLPPGGYYYAVIVLKQYKRYTQQSPPPCASSSNMQKTDYGYPRPGRPMRLALTPAKSAAGHWCRGGVYSGGIYAVPYPPPCNSTYPCRSEPYKEPCAGIRPGCVEGVVARPGEWAYPEGLPAPRASGTTLVGHFTVAFPSTEGS
jgi:hypothetical protein